MLERLVEQVREEHRAGESQREKAVAHQMATLIPIERRQERRSGNGAETEKHEERMAAVQPGRISHQVVFGMGEIVDPAERSIAGKDRRAVQHRVNGRRQRHAGHRAGGEPRHTDETASRGEGLRAVGVRTNRQQQERQIGPGQDPERGGDTSAERANRAPFECGNHREQPPGAGRHITHRLHQLNEEDRAARDEDRRQQRAQLVAADTKAEPIRRPHEEAAEERHRQPHRVQAEQPRERPPSAAANPAGTSERRCR